MREREAMNLPALGVAIAGPLAGIGIWYAVDRWTGHPGLALGLAAGVIYVSARLTRALASATSLMKRSARSASCSSLWGFPTRPCS